MRQRSASLTSDTKGREVETNDAGPQHRSHASRWYWCASGIAIFLGILAWRHDFVASPPYEEQATGLWIEADYLARTGFDYLKLRREEPNFISPEKGARAYMVSLQPTLLAILLKTLSPPRAVIVAWHLLTFACTAVIVVFVVAILRPYTGLLGSLLCGLLLLTTPLFSVQVEMAGMDVAIAVFSLWACWLVIHERFIAAAFASTAAFLMKANGGIVTVATIVYLAIAILFRRGADDSDFSRRAATGLGVHLLVLLGQFLFTSWGDATLDFRRDIRARFSGDNGLLNVGNAIYWCPDVVGLIVACAIVGVLMLFAGMLSRLNRGQPFWRAAIETVDAVVRRQPVWIFSWLVVVGTLLSTKLYLFTPRYFSSSMPFLAILAGLTFFQTSGFRIPAAMVVCALISFNLLNADGRFYPSIEDIGRSDFERTPMAHARWSVLLERSLEYRRDHLSNMRAMRVLEQDHHDEPLLASFPHYWYATEPRYGYVEQPLNARRVLNYEQAAAMFREVVSDDDAGERNPIFIWYGAGRLFLPEPEPGDEIFYEDELSPPLVVYRKRWSEEIPRGPQAEPWYLDRTWPGPWLSMRTLAQAQSLLELGDVDGAMQRIRATLTVDPRCEQECVRHVKQRLVSLLVPEDEAPRESLRDLNDALFAIVLQHELIPVLTRHDLVSVRQVDVKEPNRWRYPELSEQAPTLAETLTEMPKLITARAKAAGTESETAEQRDTTLNADALCQLGMAALRDARLHDACELFEQALDAPRSDDLAATTHFVLGELFAQQGLIGQAADHYQAAIDERPEFAEAYYGLGIIRLEQRRFEEARIALGKAIERVPHYGSAHHNLAVALMRLDRPDAALLHFLEAFVCFPVAPEAQQDLALCLCRSYRQTTGENALRQNRGRGVRSRAP